MPTKIKRYSYKTVVAQQPGRTVLDVASDRLDECAREFATYGQETSASLRARRRLQAAACDYAVARWKDGVQRLGLYGKFAQRTTDEEVEG